jgi:iron complex outermembrane receptor protein
MTAARAHALFAEWEGKLMNAGPRLVGVRDELVKTDAGNVQPMAPT